MARNAYYLPGLIAYTIALDLAKNGLGSRVDIAPPALEDYDLVIHGKLRSNQLTSTELTYGLGPLRFVSNMAGMPQRQREVVFEITYVVYDARGEVALEVPLRKEWSKLLWEGQQDVPLIHGQVLIVQEANRDFVASLAARLREPPLAPEAETVRSRVRLYHSRLDPELPELLAARDRLRLQSPRSLLADAVEREVERRARLLESYRRTEDRIISDQQAQVWRTQQQILEDTARVRQLERETEARHEALERQHAQATLQPLAGALFAGIQPALGSAQAQGQWNDGHWQQLNQDLGAAFAAMPPPPTPG